VHIRFVSVTDRFLGELSPVALGQVPKDLDMRYENLVKGIRHIQIKVYINTFILQTCIDRQRYSGVASGGFRRRCRVHGVTVKVFRTGTWPSSKNHICRDSCSSFASDRQGKPCTIVALHIE
jgi:Cell morphogenesis N-terminal